MTLPVSGAISIADIAAEYGLALPVTLPADLYGKPGLPASGPLTIPDSFYGKSNAAFTPDGGAVADDEIAPTNAVVTLVCTTSAVWTWSVSSGLATGYSVSIASGGAGTSIVFTRSSVGTTEFTVNGSAGGVSRNFTVTLTKETSGGGGGGGGPTP